MMNDPAVINPENIRTVLFDLDGTLRHNRPDANGFFFDHAATLGAPDSAESRRRGYRWAHKYWNSKGGMVSDISKHGQNTEAFWVNYAFQCLIAYGCPTHRAAEIAPAMHRHMDEEYEPEDWIDPVTFDVLWKIKRAGHVLGLVSNRNESCDDLLERLDLLPYFDFTLVAGQAGSWKPDPGIFDAALEISGGLPGETIYIGDNYFADVEGARNASLNPVLLDIFEVFPDANCPVIGSLVELESILGLNANASKNSLRSAVDPPGSLPSGR